ncbi:hypothetical protein EE387_22170 [Salmonella enterica]|nr:hypothetical protein [Salmonella enterica]
MIQEYDYGVRPVTNTGHVTAGPAGNAGRIITGGAASDPIRQAGPFYNSVTVGVVLQHDWQVLPFCLNATVRPLAP